MEPSTTVELAVTPVNTQRFRAAYPAGYEDVHRERRPRYDTTMRHGAAALSRNGTWDPRIAAPIPTICSGRVRRC